MAVKLIAHGIFTPTPLIVFMPMDLFVPGTPSKNKVKYSIEKKFLFKDFIAKMNDRKLDFKR
jgi:hypothetical protein